MNHPARRSIDLDRFVIMVLVCLALGLLAGCSADDTDAGLTRSDTDAEIDSFAVNAQLDGDQSSVDTAGGDPTTDSTQSSAPSSTLESAIAGANATTGNELRTVEPLTIDPASSGRSWSDLGAVEGLLTFRGNPTRTWYGRGPIPDQPEIRWTHTIGCSQSSVGGQAITWCGTGWTGQPAVFPAPDGDGNWVGVGGYNQAVNFFDPETGDEAFPPFLTGDIIKGTITVDPDGYPLVYSGSRDDFYHIIAIDGTEPRELWRLSATGDEPTMWNNDWDSSGIIIDDHLIVGGENSRFYVVELNRGYDADGSVTVDPEVVFSTAGWDDQLLADVGDGNVSIESSVAMAGSVAYAANSGGLIQGWDVAAVIDGEQPERVFRFWTGDDTDATVVVDDEGMLYAVSEYERGNARAKELGQVMKLDPSNPDDPLVWSQPASSGLDTGVWATPAIHNDTLIVPTDDGRVIGFDRADGATLWTLELPGPLWSSPAVVDDTLIQGDCAGNLHAFDLGPGDGSSQPQPRWTVTLGGCIESTPAVWDGWIYVGTRSGEFFAIADR
jgi:hypothetical protein